MALAAPASRTIELRNVGARGVVIDVASKSADCAPEDNRAWSSAATGSGSDDIQQPATEVANEARASTGHTDDFVPR